MSEQNYVAIGDVHGCPESLKSLLLKLDEYEDRKLVFVGDYIDRGPDSKAVVDFLIGYAEDHDCVFLRGNHEQMLLNAYREGESKLWLHNGGDATLRSYGTTAQEMRIPEKHLDFYRQTELYYDTPDWFFVHAGVNPGKKISECMEDEKEKRQFLWERSHLNAFETPWEKTVVFGHTPRQNPIRKDKMIGIDTGCVFDTIGYGTLTAVLLPEIEFIQQKCLDR